MATTAFRDNIEVGRVLQRGFTTIGRNALAFFGIAILLVGLPTMAANMIAFSQMAALQANPFDSGYWGSQMGLILVGVIAGYLLQAAIVRSAILDLGGRPADMGGSLRVALGRLLPLIGLSIVTSIGIGFGILLLIVPGVILYLMWIVAVPVMIEERRGIFASLSRSAELAKGSKGQIFGVVMILFLMSGMISAVFVQLSLGSMQADPILFGLFNGLIGVASGVVMAAILASLYVELRTVKEGADSDTLAAVFE